MSDIRRARNMLMDARRLVAEDEIKKDALVEMLHRIEQLMYREKPAFPPARAEARVLTPELAARIRAAKFANPKLSHLKLARQFETGIGRVSEALQHKI